MKTPKSVKVFYMGQRLKDVYPHATRWQVIKYKTARALRWFAIRVGAVAAVMLFGSGMYILGQFDNNRTVFAQNIFVHGNMDEKIDAMKRELIDDLSKRENAGGVPCYQDDNKAGTLPKKDKISCGPMAYKVSTVQRHAKECGVGHLSDDEAVALALDDERAKELAECAIFEHGHIGEWYGATSEMVTRVSIIRELEK